MTASRSRAFGAKVMGARAVGSISRRSGRGGGTTLPAPVAVRTALDAIGFPRGSPASEP